MRDRYTESGQRQIERKIQRDRQKYGEADAYREEESTGDRRRETETKTKQ